MPIYMDVHHSVGDVTADDVAEAHRRDLEIQSRYGVKFLSYWFSDPEGKTFCLVEAPDVESLVECHKVAHGLTPHSVIEVAAPTLSQFMGETVPDRDDRAMIGGRPDSGLRAIMFTDIEGSTDISTLHGDDVAVALVRRHDNLVRKALAEFRGREVKHTGDGILASFVSVTGAVDASVSVQRMSHEEVDDGPQLAINIGVSAGEPVEGSNDIYGAAVNLAARICAHAVGGQTLVSASIRDLSIGKSKRFTARGTAALKGFVEPVELYEVDWSAPVD
jgi:class 3 adenylate cyclase